MSSGRVEVSYHAVVQGGSEKMMMMIMRRRYGGWDVIVDRGRMRCFFTGAPPILFLNTRNSIVRVLVDEADSTEAILAKFQFFVSFAIFQKVVVGRIKILKRELLFLIQFELNVFFPFFFL